MGELRKARVPEGALRIEIDEPSHYRLDKPAGVIRGWLAARDAEIPEEYSFRIAGVKVPHRRVKRSDVELAMPDHKVTAFEIAYDLVFYLPYIEEKRLVIDMNLPGYDDLSFRFQVTEKALALCLAGAGGV